MKMKIFLKQFNRMKTLAAKRGKSGLKTTTIPCNSVKDEELVICIFIYSISADYGIIYTITMIETRFWVAFKINLK